MTIALLLVLLVVVLVLWWRDRRHLHWRIAQAMWQTRVEQSKAARCRSQRKHTRYL